MSYESSPVGLSYLIAFDCK